MQSHIRSILSISVLVITITVLAVYGWAHKNVFLSMVTVQWNFLIYLFFMRLMLFFIQGLRTKIFLDFFTVRIRFREWFGLSIITSMTNILTPLQGGMILRGMYLKKKHDFSYSVFASVQLASYILSFLVTGVLAIILVYLLYLKYNFFNLNILLFFLTIISVVTIFLMISPSISPSQSRIKEAFRNALEGWKHIRDNSSLICKILLINCIYLLILSVRLFLGYRALSLAPGFLPVLMIALISNYTILFRVTPGNLGIIETVTALLSKMMGIGFNQGLAVAVLLRGISLLMVFTFGPLFSYLLTGELTYRGNDS